MMTTTRSALRLCQTNGDKRMKESPFACPHSLVILLACLLCAPLHAADTSAILQV
ncbi:MAG: hypothetical protein ABMA26_25700 [Limisphaerales bacterium]